jgi:multiple sugar transport system permease protein
MHRDLTTPRRLARRRWAALPRGRIATSLALYALAGGVAALFCVPLLWMITTSLRPVGLPLPTGFEWIPPAWALDNYRRVFEIVEMGRFLGNSLLVMVVAVPLTVLTASLAGFGLSQLPRRARNGLLAVAVAAMLVPKMALWVTLFLVYKTLGLLNTPLVLIAPAIMGTNPLFVLMFAWAFLRIPADFIEQARLDGAGAWQVWWAVGLPLVRPVALAVVVLATEFYWSDFINPLLFVTNSAYYTLPVGVQALQQMARTNWPLLMAGGVLLTVPVLLTFVIAQRFFFQEERGRGWLGR